MAQVQQKKSTNFNFILTTLFSIFQAVTFLRPTTHTKSGPESIQPVNLDYPKFNKKKKKNFVQNII